MSRTRESAVLASPVDVFIFFNGNTGKFGRPIEGQDKGMQDLSLPLSFVVLDDGAFRIGGETRGGGVKRKISSNTVHRDFSTALSVVYKDNGALIAEGTWGQIGQQVKDLGGKYTLVLYVLTKIDGEYKIAAIHLRGRALAEWFKFTKGKDLFGNTAFSVKSVSKTDGEEIDSFVPVFSETTVSPETVEEANAADTVLQSWLKASFENPHQIEAARPQVTRGETPPPSNAKDFPMEDVTSYEEPAPVGDDLPF